MKKQQDPFKKHLAHLRLAIRECDAWRGAQHPDDYHLWDAQNKNQRVALAELHKFALLGYEYEKTFEAAPPKDAISRPGNSVSRRK